MSQTEAEPPKNPRRQVLRLIGLAGIGGVAVLATSSFARGYLPGAKPSGSAGSQAASPPTYPMTVQVNYYQMKAIPVAQDTYTFQGPATYSDLVTQVEARYPIIVTMMPTMTAFVNDLSAKPGTALKNGDQVYFVPAFAGG